jgi:anhydro-N-acetylmuramic acid kinase
MLAQMSERLFIGAMSGTSADGVDTALVSVNGSGLAMTARLQHHCHKPYNATLREMIFAVRSGEKIDLADLAKLAREISLVYADAVRELLAQANVSPGQITAIAAHGQTLFHDPPLTIQWFDPSLLAWETGCCVVSDFRRADCAAGGQGAPLVPFADYILFRHPTKNRVLLNIGGIANLTYLRAGGSIDEVIAFDTGPGNCISDWICRTHGPFGLSWDVDGQGAAHGRAIIEITRRYLDEPYFKLPPPKSTDTLAMIRPFELAADACGPMPLNDLLATAARITGDTIARGIQVLPREGDLELIVSGGGIHNKAIMGWLRSYVDSAVTIHKVRRFRIPADAKEAVAFALLGAATMDGVPSNVPSVTGASRGMVLGSITPRISR